MAAGRYSFIDLAVLEEVRARFAAGDALAILDAALETVIWANGPGAALFGFSDIEAVMGASPGLGLPARRQISATPGFPRMGRDRPLLVRLAGGVSGQAVAFLASGIALPDGEPAVLLAVPARRPDGISEREIAQHAIEGFREAGYFAALVDGGRQILAATEGFAELGIGEADIGRLVGDVTTERDRLVKRLVPAKGGLIPAGIARLTDEPALHLLIAVDEPVEEEVPEEAPESPAVEEDDAPEPSDADLLDRIDEDRVAVPATIRDHPDDWYFREERPAEAGAKAKSAPAVRNLPAAPIRFVWRTDANGAFSALSSEFVTAVGVQAAEIIGRPFGEVAAEFGIDPDGSIATLLDHRDTWSGRTVLWPVSGSDLAVPVDLAALPVYNRERSFEGFRGFGVARMGDARPQEREAATPAEAELTPTEAAEQSPQPAAEEKQDAFQGEVPVISIAEHRDRRTSDKVIRLAEHRPGQPQGRQLSPGERSAFEEIRARLRKDYEMPQEAPPAPAEAAPAVEQAAPEAAAEPAATETAEDFVAEPADERERDDTAPAAADAAQEDAAGPSATAPISDAPELPAEAQGDEAPEDAFDAEPEAATESESPAEEAATETGRPVIDGELIDGLPLPLLVHAGDDLYFANREFLSLTGYASLDQIRREGGLDRLFVGQDDNEPSAGEDRRLRLRTLGGEEFPVDAHLQSVRWRDGTALLLSLRRAVETSPAPAPAPAPLTVVPAAENDAELERRVEEMRTIIDTATDGVVLIAADGAIRSISRPAEALFGLDSAQVEGKPFASLFAYESQRAARDYLDGLAGNGVASVLNDGREVIGREAEGGFIPLFMTIGRLPKDSGYCAVLRDITQWKRAEEELTQARAQAERASSQKTEFLARVSHEIRTPLNAIIGFSELMMDEKFGPIGSDRYRDYLRDINRSGNHVLDLVNDLLDISKIEAGEQEMNYEAVSLNDTLSECVAMMQPEANRDRVIIRSSFASRLPEVVADLRSVRQIALNLLSNAVRYTQAGGQVIVSTGYEPAGDVVMRVRDTGIGMTLSEIDQALKPFKQINALKRGRHDGTGLGLPLTKAMVEANRAKFSIASTPGEGTMVEVIFPSTRVLAD